MLHFNVIEVLLSFRSIVTPCFDRFTEIFPCAWIPFSGFSNDLHDLLNGLSNSIHHPMDMARLCNVEYILNS